MSALGHKQTFALQKAMSALRDRESGDLYTVLAGSELGFDESGEGENLRRCPLHSDLCQNRLELLAKPIKGRS
jgi:hypothetical protein